jgi:hypothetical protein
MRSATRPCWRPAATGRCAPESGGTCRLALPGGRPPRGWVPTGLPSAACRGPPLRSAAQHSKIEMHSTPFLKRGGDRHEEGPPRPPLPSMRRCRGAFCAGGQGQDAAAACLGAHPEGGTNPPLWMASAAAAHPCRSWPSLSATPISRLATSSRLPASRFTSRLLLASRSCGVGNRRPGAVSNKTSIGAPKAMRARQAMAAAAQAHQHRVAQLAQLRSRGRARQGGCERHDEALASAAQACLKTAAAVGKQELSGIFVSAASCREFVPHPPLGRRCRWPPGCAASAPRWRRAPAGRRAGSPAALRSARGAGQGHAGLGRGAAMQQYATVERQPRQEFPAAEVPRPPASVAHTRCTAAAVSGGGGSSSRRRSQRRAGSGDA